MRPIYNSQEKMFGESGREKKAFTLDNTNCRWGGYLKKKAEKKGTLSVSFGYGVF